MPGVAMRAPSIRWGWVFNPLAASLALLLAGFGCGSEDVCTPGATQECPCDTGGWGTRACASDGTGWSFCTACPSQCGLAAQHCTLCDDTATKNRCNLSIAGMTEDQCGDWNAAWGSSAVSSCDAVYDGGNVACEGRSELEACNGGVCLYAGGLNDLSCLQECTTPGADCAYGTCYLYTYSGEFACAPTGDAQAGDTCSAWDECAAGNQCLEYEGDMHCFQICLDAGSCPSAEMECVDTDLGFNVCVSIVNIRSDER